MFKALRDDAATLVTSLWQCGLTATIHLRQGLGVKASVEISCKQRELQVAKDMISDTFPAVRALRLDKCVERGRGEKKGEEGEKKKDWMVFFVSDRESNPWSSQESKCFLGQT